MAVIYRLASGYWWWRDFDAVLCAGVRHANGLAIYAPHLTCRGLGPADFVYPPQIAWIAAWLEQRVSLSGLRLGFALIQLAASLWLGWLMLLRRLPHLSIRARLPALGLVGGGAIACGNIAIACHALVAASLLGFKRTRLPFIAAVALISAIKPLYAVYLVVLLLDAAPWRARLARWAAGAAALAVVGFAIWRTGGPELIAWQEALHRVLEPVNLGGGVLRMLTRVGMDAQGPAALAAFAAFAGLMTLAGVMIVEARGRSFSAEERWLFGLGLVAMINPRPMTYDLLTLAPAIALTTAAAQGLSPGSARLVRRWLLGLCILACAMGAVFLGGHAAAWTPALLALAVLYVGLGLALRRLRPRLAEAAPAAEELPPAAAAAGAPVLSLVICTLDEEEAIAGVISGVDEALAQVPHEIIVVDDSPGDGTAAAVLRCAETRPDVRLIRRPGAHGLASAAIAGWEAARGRLLGVMDGDGQHDPRTLPALCRALGPDGAEVALASRYARRGVASGLIGFRDRISRLATALTHLVLGVRVSDPMSGFFLMRRSWFEHVRPRLSGVGFKILVDVIVSGSRRPRTAEVAASLRPRAGGVSKLDLRVMADLAGLLVEKATRGVVSARLALFLAVGLVGVAVHMTVLGLGGVAGAPFWAAQGVAILVAMTSNFALNNALTFRHARLSGRAAMRGLGLFYASCLAGAVLNETLSSGVRAAGAPWAAAAACGLIAGAVCNYALATRLTWRAVRATPRQGFERGQFTAEQAGP
jgi:dolichol-phosphate mannosyltransferase